MPTPTPDIEIKALAFWRARDDGDIAVGFAASEDPEDGYVLFDGPEGGSPDDILTEVSDEIFAATGAIGRVVFDAAGFTLTVARDAVRKLGMVETVRVMVDPADDVGQAALADLRALLPASLVG